MNFFSTFANRTGTVFKVARLFSMVSFLLHAAIRAISKRETKIFFVFMIMLIF